MDLCHPSSRLAVGQSFGLRYPLCRPKALRVQAVGIPGHSTSSLGSWEVTIENEEGVPLGSWGSERAVVVGAGERSEVQQVLQKCLFLNTC